MTNKEDIQLAKFSQLLGILNNTFKPNLVQKFLRAEVYNSLAVPILSYGSQI